MLVKDIHDDTRTIGRSIEATCKLNFSADGPEKRAYRVETSSPYTAAFFWQSLVRVDLIALPIVQSFLHATKTSIIEL